MIDQNQIVKALMTPEAYVEDPKNIELIQTHISFIFLTREFVYKVKKAVNFGFLDFTTLRKRRFYCEKELELNRRLCREMYLEVVPINKGTTIRIKGEGKPVEYAVKMKRMPQEKIMSKLLERNKIGNKIIDRIARIVAEFHSKAKTNSTITSYGSLRLIETNWKENFKQTKKFINDTINAENFRLIRDKVEEFMRKNTTLFTKRMSDKRVRDCHGDIHSGNIFITDKIYIFDAIEFNERFRYSDTVADVAFLAMDLDFRNRGDLSDFFITKYSEYSRDLEMTKLLPFYECYRAYVRGKVTSFRLNDPNISKKEKREAEKEASLYFKLATNYTKKF